MLESITPIILTYNEAPNIARALEKLSWALDVVVVDSFSDDDTMTILKQFPKVRVFQRNFDSHATQWNYAVRETGVKTAWVLALDADYVLTDDLIEELKALNTKAKVSGYKASFRYCVNGHPLRGAAYPPVTVLYQKERVFYHQDGHTQQVIVNGNIDNLKHPILHDDRKSLAHWVSAQSRYMKLEAEKLLSKDSRTLHLADRIRRMYFFAPFAIFFYCLFVKKGILDGRAGLFYAFQRMFAEILLSLHLLEGNLEKPTTK